MILAHFVYVWYLHVTSEAYFPPSDHLVSVVLVVTWRIVSIDASPYQSEDSRGLQDVRRWK